MSFHSTLLVIIEKWKWPQGLSTGKWRNKIAYVNAMKYYSAIKKEWCYITDLDYIMLSKRSQTQKTTYLEVSSYINAPSKCPFFGYS
jgi:hypothetical protein